MVDHPSDAAALRQLRLERRSRLRDEASAAEAQQQPSETNRADHDSQQRGEEEESKEEQPSASRTAGPVPVSAASSCPRGQKRRETGSTSTSTLSAAVQVQSSAAAAVGKPAKKSKPSSDNNIAASSGSSSSSSRTTSSRRTYNLRPTVARARLAEAPVDVEAAAVAAAAAVITPRTPAISAARQIHFDDSSHAAAAAATASFVPPGVVDIFCRNSSHCQPCQCPSDRCVLTDTSLGFSHIAAYGEENGDILKEKETRQMDAILRLLPERMSRVQGSGSTANTNDDDLDHEDDDLDEDSDEEDASRSSRNRNSTAQFRRVNLQESFRAGASSSISSGGAQLSHSSSTSSNSSSHHRPFASNNNFLVRQPYLSPRMRGILVHWLVEVGQEYKVSDTAFHLAVSILDLLLLKGPTAEQLSRYDNEEEGGEDDGEEEEGHPWFLVNRSDFQAVGCACAWIAAKLEDKNSPSVEDFVWISDHSFHSNKLRSLEEQVCRELDFCLNRVTPYHFVNIFLRASNACPSGGSCEFDHPVLRQVTMYLLALSRLSYELSLYKPSLLAAAAVYLARATVGVCDLEYPNHAVHPEGFWTRTLEYYTGYKREELRHAVHIIHRYQLGAERAENITGIFTKFSKPAHHYASLKTALRVEDLGFETRLTHDTMDMESIQMEPF